MGNTIRGVLALVAFVLLAAVAVSEQNPVFLILGVITAALFLLFGRKRSHGRHGGGNGGEAYVGDYYNGFGGDGGGNGRGRGD